MPGQEALQHAAHEKGAAAFEEQLVEFEGDLEAAPVGVFLFNLYLNYIFINNTF